MEDTDIDPLWRKASYSGGANGSCVEVGQRVEILVRDTTDRDGVVLRVPASAWHRLVDDVRSGRMIR